VLGGYTSTTLNDYNNYYDDEEAFLFNLAPGKSSFSKFTCNQHNTAIYHTDSAFIQFGEGPDLFIGASANDGMSSSSYVASYGDGTINNLNVGDASEIFNLEEIEVYQLTIA